MTDRRVDADNPNPHFDGPYEGPINDPLGSAQMGIRNDVDNEQERNPFHVTPKKDKGMDKLGQLLGQRTKNKKDS